MNDYKSDINIRKLDASTQKLASNFHCGNMIIDAFLKGNHALDDGFGKTYVWLDDDNKEVIGFYNISAGSVDYMDNGDRYKMGGSVHINDFALDQKYQQIFLNEGIKLSDILLRDCINRIYEIRKDQLGFSFITLQSTPEGYNLYTRNDFEEIEEDMGVPKLQDIEIGCKAMYLALDF